MSNINLKQIRKSYDGQHDVLAGIDLTIRDGEFVVLVGPSGCGKSTLLRMICGLESITGGELSIGDKVVNDLPPAQRGVAMVFQSYALYPHMTVYKNMAFGLKIAGASKKEIERRIHHAAGILQIDHLLKRLPRELSGGQRQRVAIGRAIVREPQVFLFDEPLSNLDAALRVQTRLEIAKLHRQLSATIVYVTHDQVEAMTLGDRIVVLNEGLIQQIGTPLQLYQQPCNLFVATFIGSPKMNLFDGTIAAITADSVTVRLMNGRQITTQVNANAAQISDKVTVGVRAEHIVENLQVGEAFTGIVSMVEHLGESNMIYLTLEDGQQMVVRGDGERSISLGAALSCSIPHHAFHVFDIHGRALQRQALPISALPK